MVRRQSGAAAVQQGARRKEMAGRLSELKERAASAVE
jgi:hypothetical protein